MRRQTNSRLAGVIGAVGLCLALVPSVTAGVRGQAGGLLFPIPAGPSLPSPCPPPPLPPGHPGPPPPAPKVAESAIPIVTTAPSRDVDLSAIDGKGMWITVFPGDTINAGKLVATAKAADLHQLWIWTGSTHDGFYGGPLLAALLPVAHAAGLAVVAWDFPTMSDPAVDAARAAAAVKAGADGFSPDIETAAEGTYLTSRRVAFYLSLVRKAVGTTPVVATVPRPIVGKPITYPYVAEAPFVDVFAPMIYWSCNEPGTVLAYAMETLQKYRPVAPVGQDYDMASEGGRHGIPSAQEVWRFLDVAHKRGALGASLYDIEAGGTQPLLALTRYPWGGEDLTPRR